MKCKLILLFGILLVVSLVRADLGSDLEALAGPMPEGWESVWQDNCQVRCTDGKCNQIIGRTFWVNDSDNKCKLMEDAKSLINSDIKPVVKYDGVHNVEVLDYNYTHIRLRTELNEVLIDSFNSCDTARTKEGYIACEVNKEEVPIKVIHKEYDEKTEKIIETEVSSVLKDYSVEKTKAEWIRADFGDVIHIGENSTTIQLQDADTENLDDTYVSQKYPTRNYGTGTNFYTGYKASSSGSITRGYIKFNLSSLPASQIIDNAVIWLHIESRYSSAHPENTQVHHVYNHTWNEETETWNIQPCGVGFDISSQCNLTYESNYGVLESGGNYTWDVTNMVKNEYDSNNISISMAFKLDNEEADDDSYGCRATSKEGSAVNNRPYLNITYSEAAPSDTCTCPTSGNWNIQCSDNCDIQACDMQTNNVLLNGTGKVLGLRNVTNATRIRLQGGCVVRW